MSKPNTYVQLLQAQKAIQQLQHDNHVIKGFTVQQCLDVALIALHNEFHFGPKMSARFESAFLDTFMAYAQMCVDDAADDPEIVYTKEKMDRPCERPAERISAHSRNATPLRTSTSGKS